MKVCSVKIRTETDGTVSTFETKGEIEFSESPILIYRDGESKVTLRLSDPLRIIREGDYTLSLTLKRGERTQGSIGIGINSGDFFIRTKHCRIERNHDAYLVYCVYQLDFGSSVQNMKLHLVAKF